uniref:Reverse transcriptase domain-containing protein n=1 Tax=Oryzias melastigma TaxID=30732 RepID=A0A3B3D7A0_ORYME
MRDAAVYTAALSHLQRFEFERCKAAAVRARVRDFTDGERSSAFFLGLEKNRQEKAVIRALRDKDGVLCVQPEKILKGVEWFYSDLFRERGCDVTAIDECLQHVNSRLSEEEVGVCEADVCGAEIRTAIMRKHNNKSPGADVLTAEFYKAFQAELLPILQQLFAAFFRGQAPLAFFCLGTVKLIYKRKGERCDLANYRPITLLNLDYKILASVFAGRMREVIPSFLSSTQAYGVPGRDIVDVILSLRYSVGHTAQSVVLSVDFVKAFDKVEHSFLWHVLDRFGFGPLFVSRLKSLYDSATSLVACNGLLTGVFGVQRSIRQGCPLSAMLYSLTVEPLALLVNKTSNISGVITPARSEVKIFQYADDTTLVLRDEHSVDAALKRLTLFCGASGAEVNFMKSVIWFLGDRTGTRNGWGFREAEGGFKVLGVWLSGDSHQVALKNWHGVLSKISGILSLWKLRRLTWRGKVVVIN